jgi:probable FeS assembly SUF system protein SufT
MSSDKDAVVLTRDVQGTLIPNGDPMDLPAGLLVKITHRLGGNFTILTDNGMFRIKREDADALGEEVTEVSSGADDDFEGRPDEEEIWNQLKNVFDPEIPVNIVDLGLVYSMIVSENEDGKYRVDVSMTLTAPGCGMGPTIAEDAETRIMEVPGVSACKVEIVWDPVWDQEMISEEGRMILGLV